jgi:hypothetical protein
VGEGKFEMILSLLKYLYIFLLYISGSVWFTSGVYSHGQLAWDGDGSLGVQGVEFWSAGYSPSHDVMYSRIAYVRGGKSD